jgi:glycosyl transferase family 25
MTLSTNKAGKKNIIMKVYVVNMERSVHRREAIEKHLKQLGISYELVNAVDGRLMSEDEARNIQAPGIELTKSEIGCMLSHMKIYEQMQRREEEFALILEDDVLITEIGLPVVFNKLEPFLSKDTVTLLTYFWIKDKKLMLRKAYPDMKISGKSTHYFICNPASVNGIGRSGAYFISKQCAKKILDFQTPKLQCRTDAWEVYDEFGIISGVHCMYPMPVTENTEHGSEIDYTKNGLQSMGKKFIDFAVRNNIPLLSYVFKKRREAFSNRYKNIVLEN